MHYGGLQLIIVLYSLTKFKAGSTWYVILSCVKMLNPVALQKAKIVCIIGLSECNKIKQWIFQKLFKSKARFHITVITQI